MIKNISMDDIRIAQKNWGDAVIRIGQDYINGRDYKATADAAIHDLYDFDGDGVLFKPTRTSAEQPFRNTKESAVSYFVGGGSDNDIGFALNPWACVRFDENQTVLLEKDFAVSMGMYYFTDSNTGTETPVEFTFGYKPCTDGSLIIFLHHSSVPYNLNK